MLVIPYLHHTGYPLTMRFRCIEQHEHEYHGKYNSLTDDPVRVYNTEAIRLAGDTIHVCEGEFDAMVLNSIGLHAIAIPGAHTWKGSHRRLLAGFSRIWVWADADEAGAEFANKITRSLRTARKVRLPKGLDVTDLFIQSGRSADALLALIQEETSAA